MLYKGLDERLPYSLSRWTDVPAAKWDWMRIQLSQGWMIAVDQRTGIPGKWSLKPEDTLGLIFWTKDPANLVADIDLLKEYRKKVHVTVTGWTEEEKGAPSLYAGSYKLLEATEAFGPENVTWRFSPVPMLPLADLTDRFQKIAAMATSGGVREVFLSFLQNNDLMPETRSKDERIAIMNALAEIAERFSIAVRLCNEDRSLVGRDDCHENLESGVCAPPQDFMLGHRQMPHSEGCGCVMAVDPFTVNESCVFGCTFCYAGNKEHAAKKRNTTRHLHLVP